MISAVGVVCTLKRIVQHACQYDVKKHHEANVQFILDFRFLARTKTPSPNDRQEVAKVGIE